MARTPPNPDESPDDWGKAPVSPELDVGTFGANEPEPAGSWTTAVAVTEAPGLAFADGRVVAAGFVVALGDAVAAGCAVGFGVAFGVGLGVGLAVGAGPDATRIVPVTKDATPS